MKKEDLIKEVAKTLGTTKGAATAVNCILMTIAASLKEKTAVKVAGFGTFKVEKRKARDGRNPRTGEKIRIEERMVPKFIPAKSLKDAVK